MRAGKSLSVSSADIRRLKALVQDRNAPQKHVWRAEIVRLAADSAYGSVDSLAWLVKKKEIAPHIPVFDKSSRTHGTFSRVDFKFDPERDRYTCPAGKELVQFRRAYATPRSGITAEGTRIYRPSKLDCDLCELKAQCCPNDFARKIPRDLHEDARDVARALAATPQYQEPVVVARRSRCCSPISSASCALLACASGDRTEPTTNFSSPPLPKT
jgi:hypothetical protein